MARSAEVVRQWRILQKIESSRYGQAVSSLAKEHGVTERTVYRDLAALQEAGFPLYDEKGDGGTRWRINAKPFKELADSSFTLTQLCALYFSRSLLTCLAGTPFEKELQGAFEKFEKALAPRMRRFLDRMPALLQTKAAAVKKRDEAKTGDTIAKMLEATLNQRRTRMRYHSISSGRTKDYIVEPYRLVYAEGGLYLFAFVREYGEMRTFAIERVKKVSLLEETFEPVEKLAPDAFPHSLGVHSGTPERIELEFSARVAPYIRERVWHSSQKMRDQADGSLRLALDVCDDQALRRWILGFGPLVRVVAPSRLAESILEDLEAAREIYAPRMEFQMPMTAFDLRLQPDLPFPTRPRPS
jgi:predicted DNA-binding transcriptional regulator YafY